ncbi:MAG: hypothetical protein FWG10_10860 [Eubacteriaceae bacterium]|nr:hypothetical protein [Eubacteriaceae bacterium]
MTEELQKLYDERVNRFVTTANLEEPDRVPILASIGTGVFFYAGKTFGEVLENYDLETEIYLNAMEGQLCDGFSGGSINHLMQTGFVLGSKTFFISPNGVTVQHHETSSMKVEEYDEFIADPMRFMADKIATRKVAAFQAEDDEEVYKSLSLLFDKQAETRSKSTAGRAIREKYGLPNLTGGSAYHSGSIAHPMDNYFDFVRGFKPTMTDMRRRPDRVVAAVEAMYPFYERQFPKEYCGPFPWMNDTHHIATFLTRDLFEIFYWPFYKKSVEACSNAGIKLISVFEGPWDQHFDLLDDLPKASMIANLERKDQVERFKKRYANQFAIQGGLSGVLRYNTAEQAIEDVKALLDIAAPGGGYLFSCGSMIAPGDGTPEKQRVVNKWVYENANY